VSERQKVLEKQIEVTKEDGRVEYAVECEFQNVSNEGRENFGCLR